MAKPNAIITSIAPRNWRRSPENVEGRRSAKSVEVACELHEWRSSVRSRGRRPIAPPSARDDFGSIPEAMAATRVVDLDPLSNVVAIGFSDWEVAREIEEEAIADRADEDGEYFDDFGPLRGGGHEDNGSPDELAHSVQRGTKAIGAGAEVGAS